ncbi:hypothetical protein ENSA5_26180 [Enhygromyxa salina]|uniref:Uncharacterized protein n=1 Tax=Enhygromyxa salina TaxID=215803 RepID=A0A2S9YAN1_9BACT|nr:hypothetical protein [Enhygromyxa salina]PRQ02159.1 hypothetical protein ENSA5_26180 [Enhygromyxa salina]
MSKKHFLNVAYKDLKNPGSRHFGSHTKLGINKQIVLSLRRGSGPQPQIHWDVTHAETDDEIFLPDPVFVACGTNGDKTKLYFDMRLPDIGGIDYTVMCRFGDSPRQHKVAEFQTWRRIMLSVQCPNNDCLRVFNSAFPKVKAAFKAAYIDVIKNGVIVDGEERTAERLGGARCEMYLTFKLPRWECYGQKFELKVTRDSVTGHRLWSKSGDLLVLDMSDSEHFRPQVPGTDGDLGYIEAIKVTCEGETLLEMPAERNFFPPEETEAYEKLCKIRKDNVVVVDKDSVEAATDMILDLNSEPLAAAKTKLAQGKQIEISVTMGLEQYGRTAGGATQRLPSFDLTFYPDSTAKKLAGVMTHEMAHTMGLVKQFENDKTGTPFENLMYHGNDYGGSGPHCRNNGKQVATGSTVSGYTYEYDASNGPLCTMHYKTDDGVDDGKFCLNCQGQLRRATLP